MNALIFAAGLGSRLGTYTQDLPKALVKVAGKPMLEHQLLHLKNAGVETVVVNVHHYADKIVDFIIFGVKSKTTLLKSLTEYIVS